MRLTLVTSYVYTGGLAKQWSVLACLNGITEWECVILAGFLQDMKMANQQAVGGY